jgi:vitamin B12/bleomycin/antimicrobial peptide transport system ATP-binding/permease protein
MRSKRWEFLREAWRLAKPYWVCEEKWIAWGLLAAVIALNLGSVYITVRLNFWRNDFYNAVQKYDEHQFFVLLGIFAVLAAASIVVAVYQLYLQQMLQIRWRRWLTRQYVSDWFQRKAYYRLQLDGNETDNPDQRIAEDLNRFTDGSLNLTLGLLNSVVTLFSFLSILWSLSGAIALPLGSLGVVTIPGYLVWCALVYSVVGTWVTYKIGRPLVGLNFQQQRYEADFRFSLVRFRENTEAVALYGGEEREMAGFRDRFSFVFNNFWAIMRRMRALGWWTNLYGQFAIIFPYLVLAPRYFSLRNIELGGLMQTADAFGQVQSSLSFIVTAYTDIATWQSVVQRLVSFDARVREIAQATLGPQPIAVTREGKGLEVKDLELDLPDGRPLLRHVALEAKPGEAVLITGPTGSGKSTLLRAISGIWPYGKGTIRLSAGRLLFLPQKAYMPLGTLRNALSYPHDTREDPDERLCAIMEQVGLGAFAGRLNEPDNWAHRLSLGEQQRFSFARVLLTEPDLIFLDESTSALDEPTEAKFYGMLREASWRPTIVSVGHRGTLSSFHDHSLDMAAFRVALEPVTNPA